MKNQLASACEWSGGEGEELCVLFKRNWRFLSSRKLFGLQAHSETRTSNRTLFNQCVPLQGWSAVPDQQMTLFLT